MLLFCARVWLKLPVCCNVVGKRCGAGAASISSQLFVDFEKRSDLTVATKGARPWIDPSELVEL